MGSERGVSAAFYTFHENFVEHPVVRTSEEHHLASAGHGACDTKRGKSQLQTRWLQKDIRSLPVMFAKHFGNFTGQGSLRSDLGIHRGAAVPSHALQIGGGGRA